jgi:hypothetical protein
VYANAGSSALTSGSRVVAIKGGVMTAIVGGRSAQPPSPVGDADAPFAGHRRATSAAMDLLGAERRPGLAADSSAAVYMVRTERHERVPAPFQWQAAFTADQRELVTLVQRHSDGTVWRVTADGAIQPVAVGASAIGVDGGWLYVAGWARRGASQSSESSIVVRIRCP